MMEQQIPLKNSAEDDDATDEQGRKMMGWQADVLKAIKNGKAYWPLLRRLVMADARERLKEMNDA